MTTEEVQEVAVGTDRKCRAHRETVATEVVDATEVAMATDRKGRAHRQTEATEVVDATEVAMGTDRKGRAHRQTKATEVAMGVTRLTHHCPHRLCLHHRENVSGTQTYRYSWCLYMEQ